MYISRVQIGNYKSFLGPPPLEFTQGFNIISGQNNPGKTALLEIAGLNFLGVPHRSIRTIPVRDTIPEQVSWVDAWFTLTPRELKELMLASGSHDYRVVKPDLGVARIQNIGFIDDSDRSAARLLEYIFAQEFLTFKLRLQAYPNGNRSWRIINNPSHGLYPAQFSGGVFHYLLFRIGLDGQLMRTGGSNDANSTDMGDQLAGMFERHVYRFAAERMKVGKSAHSNSTMLARDASNLPEVLNQLQHNPSKFRDLSRQLNLILPQVKQVSVRASGPGQVEIVVWSHDPETKREDLVVPLEASGTGIGQVLAILYVVMTSDRPQTIIIDEPQSFLHPGAARKLIEFLRLNAHHQFMIATHSATIIAAADPKTITLAQFEDGVSTLQQLDAVAEKGIQTTLAELGIRLSDSFGADSILWVEGRTEEKCFRLIVERILRQSLRGTEILGIRQTGDLEGRDAKKVFEIYRNLTSGSSLLPPAIAFILDRECRSEDAKRELFRLSGNRAIFLRRRMFENYLLNPMAIAAVANAIDGFRSPLLTAEHVSTAIESRLSNIAYFCAGPVGEPADRLSTVDGARILEEIFSELSETRVAYQKVRHGIALTEWLITNSAADLREVTEMLQAALDSGIAGVAI